MIRTFGTKALTAVLIGFTITGCYRSIDTEKNPIPPHTLAIEFAKPMNYVLELLIDGKEIPIKFVRKNRVLRVEGLTPGKHSFELHSITYVLGPEFEEFTVNDSQGAYFFIQARKYRSALPKNRAETSIRAYRKKLKKAGIDVRDQSGGKLRAYFSRK